MFELIMPILGQDFPPSSFNPLSDISWSAAYWASDPGWTKPTDKGLNLFGVSQSFASTPDSAAISITGDICMGGYYTMNDWTPTGGSALIAKWTGTGNQRSFVLQISSGGLLQLILSSDGTSTTQTINNGSTPGFTDGTGHWVAATYKQSTGAVNFYISDDPPTTAVASVSWTGAGSPTTTTASIYDSTTVLEVGTTYVGGTNFARGSVARAFLGSGSTISTATLQFDANFLGKSGQASFTESSSNGALVTIGAKATLGGLVSSWRDGSGNGHDVASTGAKNPTYYTSSAKFNSKPTLMFGDSSLQARLLTTIAPAIAQPNTWVVIKSFDGTLNASQMRTIDGYTGGSGRQILGGWDASHMVMYAGTNVTPSLAIGSAASLDVGFFSGASSWVERSGTRSSTVDVGTNSVDAVGIGSDTGTGAHDGQIAFVGLYSGDITAHPQWSTFKSWVATYYDITIA